MNINPLFVKTLVFSVLAVIVTGQAIWIRNMYVNYQKELAFYTNESLQQAILMEITERTEQLGGFRAFSLNMSAPNDTSRYFIKQVRSEDKTYSFRIDKYDPHNHYKFVQFFQKDDYPVNLETAQKIFREKLSQHYPIRETWLEYLDLESDSVITTNRPEKYSTDYLVSDTLVMDIQPSIAMLAFVEMPESLILRKMSFQLLLSIVLIVLAGLALLYLIRSFVGQWRMEKLRQESIRVMTHEFKRPISGAVAMIDRIPYYLEKNNTEKVISYAEKTMLELKKLTAYTDRILQISNNDKRALQLNKVPIGIRPFFEEICQHYRESNPRIKIELAIETRRSTLDADLLHFSNVIDNLIENAIKYSGEDVEIRIRVADSGEKLTISVIDNGWGIRKPDLYYIFDRYYRSNQKQVREKPGFGLGLTYVKSTIEAHGGEVCVESAPGKGSTFTIIFL